MKPVVQHQAATSEMAEAAVWYDQLEPGLSERFERAVEQTKSFIQRQPALGAPYRRGTRMRVVKGFPYLIIYRELEDIIVVVAIAHGKQMPGYWEGRLSR